MILRFLKGLFILLFLLGFLAVAGAGGVLYWLVAVDPGPEIELSYIESILGRESPVFYRDGHEKVGVLFQDAHRQYLPYRNIPKDFVNAIVAAEDDQFFHHFGIDFFGIARAMVANFKAGRIIQGGSTITQQTAKNLFKRESRTYQAKLVELLYALRLEYHYPKEKILEFYINQFFVSGNGHGLGVAARYYFDKEVNELTLLENAFIAGSVKRPNYYNPFTKSTEEAAEKAKKRANERAAYVLRNMLRLGSINKKEFDEATGKAINFQRGRMSFALNTIMDLVREGLSAPEITEALEEHGISNASTSGIRIFTTVDKKLQDTAMASLRSELSRLDIRLRGYARLEVQNEYAGLDYYGDQLLQEGAFVFGRIKGIEHGLDTGKPRVMVDLGYKHPGGVIDRAGLEKALNALVRFNRNQWISATNDDLPLLLGQLWGGDKVYVSVREKNGDGTFVLNLERFPKLQGAALVLQQGAIRAMIGGSENRYFNRAVDAKRLMGSTFKPFLFTAALQLGWSPTDLLKNNRDVFVFQDIPYFPRPDHNSPHDYVSMSWTGVKSENLAAVWLLYHLADHLTPPRLHEVAASLGLAPENETTSARQAYYRQLIRDRYGVVVNQEILAQAAYDRAIRNLEADFLFEGRGDEYRKLETLPYGLHFDAYADSVVEQLEMEEEEGELSNYEEAELELRLAILGRTYLGLLPSLEALEQNKLFFEVETTPAKQLDPLALLDRKSGNLKPIGLFWKDKKDRLIFSLGRPQANWTLVSEKTLRSELEELELQQQEDFWGNVMVEDELSMYTFQQVSAQMTKEKEYLASKNPYSMDVLTEVRDFRILVGLQYLIELGKELGVSTELEPVLSFPLGSNVISLLDGVRMYEAMVTGMRFAKTTKTEEAVTFFNESSINGLAIIDRIVTMDGKEIYSRNAMPVKIVDPKTSTAVADILRNTVKYGTGRYASENTVLNSGDPERKNLLAKLDIPIPLMGKTGTANNFRNAAFLGYVPVLADKDSVMELAGGYSVGVYVGYDDNKAMRKGSSRITGATGALPTWTDIAQELINLNQVGEQADIADLSFNGLPLRYPETDQVFVPVSLEEGGIPLQGRGALRSNVTPAVPVIYANGGIGISGFFEPERRFVPFWKNHTPTITIHSLQK